jgi:hypothetical protein
LILVETAALCGLYAAVAYFLWPISQGVLPTRPGFWRREGGGRHLWFPILVLIALIAGYALYIAAGPIGGHARIGWHLGAMLAGGLAVAALGGYRIGNAIFLYPFLLSAALVSAGLGWMLTGMRHGP